MIKTNPGSFVYDPRRDFQIIFQKFFPAFAANWRVFSPYRFFISSRFPTVMSMVLFSFRRVALKEFSLFIFLLMAVPLQNISRIFFLETPPFSLRKFFEDSVFDGYRVFLPGNLILLFFVVPFLSRPYMTRSIDFISWNVCGLQKLARFPSVLATFLDAHVIFLQETLQVSQSFSFPGFTRFDVPAAETSGRASGGLTILFANSVFSSFSFEVLLSEPFLLLVEASSRNGPTLLFGNIYIPRFSGSSPSVYIDVLEHVVAALEASNPISCIVAGDWNAHPHAPSSPFDRAFLHLEAELKEMGWF